MAKNKTNRFDLLFITVTIRGKDYLWVDDELTLFEMHQFDLESMTFYREDLDVALGNLKDFLDCDGNRFDGAAINVHVSCEQSYIFKASRQGEIVRR